MSHPMAVMCERHEREHGGEEARWKVRPLLDDTCHLCVAEAEILALRKRVEELEGVINPALEGLERVGWPCRLQELPDLYSKLAAELEISAGSAAMTIRLAQARAEKAEAILRGAVCPGCDGSGTISRESPGDDECPYGCRGDSFAQVLARADNAERELSERDALLGWIDQALQAAHPDTDVSDFGRNFEIVRRVVDRCLEAQATDMHLTEAERERDDWRAAATTHIETIGILSDQKIQLQADLDAALDWLLLKDQPSEWYDDEERMRELRGRFEVLLAARKEEKRG